VLRAEISMAACTIAAYAPLRPNNAPVLARGALADVLVQTLARGGSVTQLQRVAAASGSQDVQVLGNMGTGGSHP